MYNVCTIQNISCSTYSVDLAMYNVKCILQPCNIHGIKRVNIVHCTVYKEDWRVYKLYNRVRYLVSLCRFQYFCSEILFHEGSLHYLCILNSYVKIQTPKWTLNDILLIFRFRVYTVHRTIFYYYITCNIHAKVCASVCPPGDNKSVITDSLSSASPSMWSYPQLSSRFFMFNEVPLGILPSLLDDSPRRLSSRQSRIHFGKFIYYF